MQIYAIASHLLFLFTLLLSHFMIILYHSNNVYDIQILIHSWYIDNGMAWRGEEGTLTILFIYIGANIEQNRSFEENEPYEDERRQA